MASYGWTSVHLVALSDAIQQGGQRERVGLVDMGGSGQGMLRQHQLLGQEQHQHPEQGWRECHTERQRRYYGQTWRCQSVNLYRRMTAAGQKICVKKSSF